jgi:hypothetical protein
VNIGQRVTHPVYGPGTVISVSGGSNWIVFEEEGSNGWSRYSGALNLGIKFDNGGPMGWAYDSTNDISELKELK